MEISKRKTMTQTVDFELWDAAPLANISSSSPRTMNPKYPRGCLNELIAAEDGMMTLTAMSRARRVFK